MAPVVRITIRSDTPEKLRKEGRQAIQWTRLSYHDFRDNEVRPRLFALAYNLGDFLP